MKVQEELLYPSLAEEHLSPYMLVLSEVLRYKKLSIQLTAYELFRKLNQLFPDNLLRFSLSLFELLEKLNVLKGLELVVKLVLSPVVK